MLKNSTNAYLSQLSISAWNIHGLGDKIEDHIFREKLNSDINILLETWTGENKKYILPEFNTISKCRKKKKKSRRYSGGIIVYYKKTISRGVTYVNYGSKSENRLWLKLDKSFFDFEHDLYVCAVYIPPVTSVHYDNDFALLENEVSIFANQGKVLLIGDFNSRTGQSPDYILNDSTDLNNFSDNYILPRNYSVDQILKRINQDQIGNAQGKNL
jgi:hypothetical protein